MRLDRCILGLRPRSTFETMDLGLVLGRRYFHRYLILFALTIGPLALFNLMFLRLLQWDPLVSIPLLLIEAPLIQVPFVLFTAELVFNPQANEWRAFSSGLKFLMSHSPVYVLVRPILFAIPLGFLVYFFRYRFFVEVSSLEQLSGPARQQRLKFLQRHDDACLILALILGLLSVVVFFGVTASYHVVVAVILGQYNFMGNAAVQPTFLTAHLALGGFLAYGYVVFFLEYLNLRTKREGWDLSLQFKMVAGT